MKHVDDRSNRPDTVAFDTCKVYEERMGLLSCSQIPKLVKLGYNGCALDPQCEASYKLVKNTS